MKKSRTVRPTAGVESPTTRRLPLVELLIDTGAELFDLAVRSGLQVLDAMLEEDRTAICGPRYAHQADRTASRAGTVASTVVLGGRKVSIRRPRVRSGRQEVPLPTFQTMAQTDPLRRRTVEQLLVGVSTRGYARSLEPLPADIPSRSVSKSAVSRRFVAKPRSWPRGRRRPSTSWIWSVACSTVSTSASTVWSSCWGSASTARSTPSGSGKVRRRTRPSVRACSPTSRVVACAPIGASS